MSAVSTVLIVDDDESIREFISLALRDEGYHVITAPDGLVALEALKHHRPSLILLDMRMPNMDGASFVRAYRETPGYHAPIIVLTAGRYAAGAAAEFGADGFLAKPFDLNELLELVTRYL